MQTNSICEGCLDPGHRCLWLYTVCVTDMTEGSNRPDYWGEVCYDFICKPDLRCLNHGQFKKNFLTFLTHREWTRNKTRVSQLRHRSADILISHIIHLGSRAGFSFWYEPTNGWHVALLWRLPHGLQSMWTWSQRKQYGGPIPQRYMMMWWRLPSPIYFMMKNWIISWD